VEPCGPGERRVRAPAQGGGAGVQRRLAAAGAGPRLELLELYAFQRDNRLIRDPVEVFNERCSIGFESDETLVYRVPVEAQQKLLGDNARRLYGIEPLMAIEERIEEYEPAILPW
jgi:hypothetical protein